MLKLSGLCSNCSCTLLPSLGLGPTWGSMLSRTILVASLFLPLIHPPPSPPLQILALFFPVYKALSTPKASSAPQESPERKESRKFFFPCSQAQTKTHSGLEAQGEEGRRGLELSSSEPLLPGWGGSLTKTARVRAWRGGRGRDSQGLRFPPPASSRRCGGGALSTRALT